MKSTTRWTYDPVVRGVFSASNGLAAVFLLTLWFGKLWLSNDLWPLAFVLALVPLRGDAHQRFWDYARTEWLHAIGLVSRARLATACVAQELVEALSRAGLILLVTLGVSSTREGASLYSWLELGCSSWIGIFAAWAGVVALVRASWSLAVNLDASRPPSARRKPRLRRNDESEESLGPIFLVVLLGYPLLLTGVLLTGLLEFARSKLWARDQGSNSHVRGSVPVRAFVALSIALPPCALALYLEHAWIPALCAAGVLALLWTCVREREFTTSLSIDLEGASEPEFDARTDPAKREERSVPPAPTARASSGDRLVPKTIPRAMLWSQIERTNLIGLGVVLLIVLALRWSIGELPSTDHPKGETGWWLLFLTLLFIPGRVFSWTSTGEQAEYFVARGRDLAWLRRVELAGGLGVVAAMAAICCLLVSGLPRTWVEWTCLLAVSAQALITCNASPATAKLRVRDTAITHAVFVGLLVVMSFGDAGEPGAIELGLGVASASFLLATAFWLRGWWLARDEAGLRTLEARFAERV